MVAHGNRHHRPAAWEEEPGIRANSSMGRHVVHAGVHAGTQPQIEPVERLGALGDGHSDQVEPLLEGPKLQRRCDVFHFREYRMRSAAWIPEGRAAASCAACGARGSDRVMS